MYTTNVIMWGFSDFLHCSYICAQTKAINSFEEVKFGEGDLRISTTKTARVCNCFSADQWWTGGRQQSGLTKERHGCRSQGAPQSQTPHCLVSSRRRRVSSHRFMCRHCDQSLRGIYESSFYLWDRASSRTDPRRAPSSQWLKCIRVTAIQSPNLEFHDCRSDSPLVRWCRRKPRLRLESDIRSGQQWQFD